MVASRRRPPHSEISMSPDPSTPRISRRRLRIAGIVLGLIAAAVAVAGIATRAADKSRLNERAEAASVPTVAVIAPGSPGDAGGRGRPGRPEGVLAAAVYRA